eukprot:5127120-Amphidinium_carterae.1
MLAKITSRPRLTTGCVMRAVARPMRVSMESSRSSDAQCYPQGSLRKLHNLSKHIKANCRRMFVMFQESQ